MSPYPGVPSEKTEAMEKCVASVLAKHSGDKGFKKENAVAICHSQIMGALALEPVTADDIAEYSNHALFAQVKPGSLLKFKNAVLCTTGENKNSDWIDAAGIKELAETMSFRAIDDEHDPVKIIGFFVNPRVEDNRLVTDGIVYNDRFPKIVAQIQSGVKKLSVEADAQRAECSICYGPFASRREYCEHLRETPYKDGAIRKLFGLTAKGGATVFHPAWDTSFDANGFVMIASQVEFEKPKSETPKWATNLIAKVESFLERLKPVMEIGTTISAVEEPKIEGGATMGEINVDELDLEELGLVRASVMETLKVDLEAKLADKDADAEKIKIGFDRVLELGMEADQLEIMANLSEAAYELFKKQQKEKPKVEIEAKEEKPDPKKETIVLEGGEGDPVPLTWETAGSVLKLKEV